ncbi:hypothetical protein WICMUC_001084 [Wickerhamomyces mucosus]|uniref:RIC1 C-terminal alpha solenoid region domain-containing protein n=1 Tax=Wickerhamomyces mucosus TaxID=1378264 RepID=A0A9P8PXZ2_9ASCO|nr:hypothetical protein WICMUC_001084 [Wickerhamomyces mucosus]
MISLNAVNPGIDSNDRILQTYPLPKNNNNKYLILTESSLILIDAIHNAIITKHERSEESRTKYGHNNSIKIDPAGTIIVVATSSNFLMIYTLNTTESISNNKEVLTVFDKNGKLLQNGYVIEHNPSVFIQLDYVESPIFKIQLRLKLVLNITNGIVDFLPLNGNLIILITKSNQQLMNLSNNSMNNLNFGDGLIKLNLIDDQLFIIKADSFEIYSLHGFKKTHQFDEKIQGLIKLNYHLLLTFSDYQLNYFDLNSLKIIKTLKFSVKIKDIKAQGDTIVILLVNNEIQILTKFGFKLYSNEELGIQSISFDKSILASTSKNSIYVIDLWRFNHDPFKPIFYNLKSSFFKILSNNQLINLIIPFQIFNKLNYQPYSIKSNEKFIMISNYTNFLIIYSPLDKKWDLWDLTYVYNKSIRIVDFKILNKNSYILVNNNNQEILIFDYFNNKLIFQYQFNKKSEILLKIINDLILICHGRDLYEFEEKDNSYQIVDTIDFKSPLPTVDITKHRSHYLLLNSIGEVHKVKKEHPSTSPAADDSTSSSTISSELLFSNIENLDDIQNVIYLFNGSNCHLIRDLSQPPLIISNLTNFPIQINLKNNNLVTIDENDHLINHNYLKDLLKLKIKSRGTSSPEQIYNQFSSNEQQFESSLEYLLYENIIVNSNESTENFAKLKEIIEINEFTKINIISAILRKIEIKQCLHIFEIFNIDSKYLLNKSIEFGNYKTLLNLLIIFLNFDDLNHDELIKYLKIIFKNGLNNDELLKQLFETLNFLKKFDKDLLQRVFKEFQSIK